jgi:hypothetical protein
MVKLVRAPTTLDVKAEGALITITIIIIIIIIIMIMKKIVRDKNSPGPRRAGCWGGGSTVSGPLSFPRLSRAHEP